MCYTHSLKKKLEKEKMQELGRVVSKDINEFNIQPEDNVTKNEDAITRISSATNAWAYIPAFVSIANLANFFARHTLDTCQTSCSLINNERVIRNVCDLPYERTLFWGGISIALFTTSLALPYLPSIVDRIKKMRVIGEDVRESSTSTKPIKANRLNPIEMLPIPIFIIGVMKSLSSFIYFSEVGIRTSLDTCTNQYVLAGYNITDFSCQTALQNGCAEILTAGILFTTAAIINNAP
jgi:hypothetical protein